MRQAALLISISFALILSSCTEPDRPTVNLFRAVEIGDLDQVKRHLYWEAAVDETTSTGEQPLHIAARSGRIAIARELVRHDASLSASDANGHTPIEIALIHGRTQLAEMLIENGAELNTQRMLAILISNGIADRDSLDFLIEQGLDLDARDSEGLAPIHRTVIRGQVELTTRLIRAGVEIDRLDGQGRTPLSIALANGDRDLARLLEQYGARSAHEGGIISPVHPSPDTATTARPQ